MPEEAELEILRQQYRTAIAAIGLAVVAKQSGASAEMLTRFLAVLPVRNGSVALLERNVGRVMALVHTAPQTGAQV